MTQRWLVRGLFATTVGLGVVAGLARAGSQTVVAPPTGPVPGPAMQPGVTLPPGSVVQPGTILPQGPMAPMIQPIPAGPINYGDAYPVMSASEGESEAGSCPTCGGGNRLFHRHHLFSHLHKSLGTALECDCWAHHDCQGCGSFQSDFHFIFGSCRDFFSEPCLKGPIPAPTPGNYPTSSGALAPGYRPMPNPGPGYGPPPVGPGSVPPPAAPGYSSNPTYDSNTLATRMPENSKNISGPIVVVPTDNTNAATRIEATTVSRPAGSYQFQQGGYR